MPGFEGLLHARQGGVSPLFQAVKLDPQLSGEQLQGLAPEDTEHHFSFPKKRSNAGPDPMAPHLQAQGGLRSAYGLPPSPLG
jgi:hypothetical protein